MPVSNPLPRHLCRRREKLFGMGRPRPMDRIAKVRIMHLARALMHATEPRKAYGAVTAKALAVLGALLWGFHNARSGVCFPSYETIAAKAHCCRETVRKAIKALEAAGLMTWCNRLKRVRERVAGLYGAASASIVRVVRTSNAYTFNDPEPCQTSKTTLTPGTRNQDLNSLLLPLPDGLAASLDRFRSAFGAKLPTGAGA